MNKIFLLLGACALFAMWFFYAPNNREETTKIGIVVPIQHEALDDIVSGFKSELTKVMGQGKIAIEVQNALGDINLQKSAINKFLNERVSLLVPIATGTARMAINMAAVTQPLLFLAANIEPGSAAASGRPDLMGVVDEISIHSQLQFIRSALPRLKKLTLIYSSNDKMPDDAASFGHAFEREGLFVQKLMIQNLSELYTVASRINNDTQAILILKDNLVASGIHTLVQQARRLKVPLITSDEGTNSKGGAFALGVVEADIGRQGARMAAAFFNKTLAGPAIEYLEKISVFINIEACKNQGVDVGAVESAAAKYKYEVVKR